MIWLIALLCLGLVGAVGYAQGAIRAAASFVGLLFAVLLSSALAPLAGKLLPIFKVQHPFWLSVLPLIVAFLAILIVFKIVGHALHHKLNMFYKYKVDPERFYRWNRMYRRLGLCVGMLNGAVYFFVLMLPIYVGGYLTTQIASGEEDPFSVRTINSIRAQLRSTKLDRVLAAYDPAPANYYVASDIIALLKQNRLLQGRLERYPVFLTLGEWPEFQELGRDIEFQELFKKPQTKVVDLINYPKVQNILTNAQMTTQLTAIINENLSDLHEYLKTGKSAKYENETILGYWLINQGATLNQARKQMQNPTPKQWNALKQALIPTIADLTLTVTTDNKAILKLERPGSTENRTLSQGTWSKENDQYKISLPGEKKTAPDVVIDSAGELMIVRDGVSLVFSKEE